MPRFKERKGFAKMFLGNLSTGDYTGCVRSRIDHYLTVFDGQKISEIRFFLRSVANQRIIMRINFFKTPRIST
jgi:hypothetical protein